MRILKPQLVRIIFSMYPLDYIYSFRNIRRRTSHVNCKVLGNGKNAYETREVSVVAMHKIISSLSCSSLLKIPCNKNDSNLGNATERKNVQRPRVKKEISPDRTEECHTSIFSMR